MIRVLIADDHELVRGDFASLVNGRDDMTVVAEATTGHEAVALALQHRPDVVLMDIRMPDLDGIEATRQLVENDQLNDLRVIILRIFDLD